jgi:hypothetical protein
VRFRACPDKVGNQVYVSKGNRIGFHRSGSGSGSGLFRIIGFYYLIIIRVRNSLQIRPFKGYGSLRACPDKVGGHLGFRGYNSGLGFRACPDKSGVRISLLNQIHQVRIGSDYSGFTCFGSEPGFGFGFICVRLL